MPRLLSSYAANKRVEDGLKRKQEQIRLDYVRATHRYIDETEKLVDDLIQINVRTPSAFQASCPSSANSTHRRVQSNQHHFSSVLINTPQNNTQHQHQQTIQNNFQNAQQYGGSNEQLSLLRSRFRSNLTSDGNTDDGTSISRKDIPLPIVQVRGKDVFYQYENQRSNWKKIEPTYRTRVLLHRNDTVANALKQYSQQKAQESSKNNEPQTQRKNSVVSRGDSNNNRRASIFSSARRGSRRDSRMSDFDDDEDDHIPPIVEQLKPQLSPGHTPRMLDGWTIMNWCLWNKKQTKPVWASKRYIERKNRELKRFQASRSVNRNELPAKPSSANPATREARRKESMAEQQQTPQQTIRAKSVPIHKVSMTIEEQEEEEDEEIKEHFPEADRGQLRPTTSILRLRRDDDSTVAEENRPKTTQTHRRVALDTYTANEHDILDLPMVNHIREKRHTHFEFEDDQQHTLRLKSSYVDGKSVKISDPLHQDEDDLESLSSELHPQSDVDSKSGHRNRIPGLAATQITITDDTVDGNITALKKNPTLTPLVPLLKTPQKINYTAVHATPVFPKVQKVVPELGSDSPH